MAAPEISCLEDMDPFATETSDPYEQILQDVFHRLIEDPGSNPDDPDRGLGLLAMLSGVLDPTLKHDIEAEVRKDPRLDGCTATISLLSGGDSNAGKTYRIDLELQVDDIVLNLALQSDGSTIERVSP